MRLGFLGRRALTCREEKKKGCFIFQVLQRKEEQAKEGREEVTLSISFGGGRRGRLSCRTRVSWRGKFILRDGRGCRVSKRSLQLPRKSFLRSKKGEFGGERKKKHIFSGGGGEGEKAYPSLFHASEMSKEERSFVPPKQKKKKKKKKKKKAPPKTKEKEKQQKPSPKSAILITFGARMELIPCEKTLEPRISLSREKKGFPIIPLAKIGKERRIFLPGAERIGEKKDIKALAEGRKTIVDAKISGGGGGGGKSTIFSKVGKGEKKGLRFSFPWQKENVERRTSYSIYRRRKKKKSPNSPTRGEGDLGKKGKS